MNNIYDQLKKGFKVDKFEINSLINDIENAIQLCNRSNGQLEIDELV